VLEFLSGESIVSWYEWTEHVQHLYCASAGGFFCLFFCCLFVCCFVLKFMCMCNSTISGGGVFVVFFVFAIKSLEFGNLEIYHSGSFLW